VKTAINPVMIAIIKFMFLIKNATLCLIFLNKKAYPINTINVPRVVPSTNAKPTKLVKKSSIKADKYKLTNA
jgi:hypothetical protein